MVLTSFTNRNAPAGAKGDPNKRSFCSSRFFRRICWAAFTLGLALTAAAQVSIPYGTYFDSSFGFKPGSLDGQQGWTVLQGMANITSGTLIGDQCVILNPDSNAVSAVAISFAPFTFPASPAPPVLWVDCVLQPVASTTSNISSYIYLDTSLAILVTTNGSTGQVYTFDGSNWVTSSNSTFSINSDGSDKAWMWLTFRLDFSAKTWDLDMLGPNGLPLILKADQPFLDDSITYLPFFEFQGDASAPSYLYLLQAGLTTLLFTDVNNDGLPDDWEKAHGFDPTIPGSNYRYDDPDGDGLTNLQEYINGTDPNDYYNGVLPALASLVDPSGVPGAQGLVSVKVTRASDGTPLSNAPVTLGVTTGASQIAATAGGTGSNSVTVRTDASGVASAYVSFTSFATDILTATAQSGTQTASLSISINPAPNNLGGLRLWLRADDPGITIANGGISRWPDESGATNNAVPSGAGPTLSANAFNNGLPAVHFDASHYQSLNLVASTMGGASQGELFVVLRSAGMASSSELFNLLGGSGHPIIYGPNGISDDFGSTQWHNEGIPAQPLTSFNVYDASASASPGRWSAWLNGLLLYETTGNTVLFNTDPNAPPQIGAGSFSGDIAEIIIYGTALTPQQRAAVMSYLVKKYALYQTPSVPTNLTAVPLSPTQISLQWYEAPHSDNVNYLVERSIDGVNFAQVAGVADSLSYIDTGLAPGTTYTYRVRAQGYAGTSAYTVANPPVTATTLLAGGGTDMPLTGMRLWLKADTGLGPAAGGGLTGAINIWPDQSGNGNDVTQTYAPGAPTLVASQINGGLPVMHFTGSQYLIVPASLMSGANQTEMFVVLRLAATAPNSQLFNLGGTGYGTIYGSSGQNEIADDFGSTQEYDEGIPNQSLTSFNVYNLSASSTGQWSTWIDGLLFYQTTGNSVGFNTDGNAHPTIGNFGGGSFSGDIAEIIIYDHALTDEERETVGFYLNSKYAFTDPAVFDYYRDGNYDGLPDSTDVALGFDPASMDVDGDGYSNLLEIFAGSDPLDKASVPSQTPPANPGAPAPTILALTQPAGAMPSN